MLFYPGSGLSFQVWGGVAAGVLLRGEGVISSVTGVYRTRQRNQVGLLVFRWIFPGLCPLVPVWSLFPAVWKISALLKSNFSKSRTLEKIKPTDVFALHYLITSVSPPVRHTDALHAIFTAGPLEKKKKPNKKPRIRAFVAKFPTLLS